MPPLPLQSMGNFFRKKALPGEANVFGQIYVGGCFKFIGTNDQIMQGGKLMVKRFQRLSQVSFPFIDPDLGYRYTFFFL